MTECRFPPGRIVKGHPIKRWPVMDDTTKKQKIMNNDELQFSSSIGYAIAKKGETEWKQTKWGKIIYDEGVAAWPKGEWQLAKFSWKIIDGDSQEMNGEMNKPCDQEGHPGHWVIYASHLNSFQCYRNSDFTMAGVITDEKEIKTGDYGQLVVNVKTNEPSQTPGVYVEGRIFNFRQAGKRIVGKNEIDPNKAFADNDDSALPDNMVLEGDETPPPPGNAPPPPSTKIPPPPPSTKIPPPPPVEDFAQEMVRCSDGSVHSKQSLIDANWDKAMVDALPKV